MNHKNKKAAEHPPVVPQPRRGTGHLPLPAGVLCLTLSNYGDRAAKLVPLLKNDPAVLVVLEPSDKNGLRVLVRAPAALARPKQAFLSAATHFERKYGVAINDDFNCCGEENR